MANRRDRWYCQSDGTSVWISFLKNERYACMLILLGKISTCCFKTDVFESHPHRIRKEKRKQWISVWRLPAVTDIENLKFSVLHKGSEIFFLPVPLIALG